MSWKRVLAGLAFATAVFVAVPSRMSAQVLSTPSQPAGCVGVTINQSQSNNSKVNNEYNHPLEMNHEGRTERTSDLAIYSANLGAPQTCFIDGNVIDVVYPEVLTNADGTSYGLNGTAAAITLSSPQTLPTGSYYVVDPSGKLAVNVKVFTVTTSGQGNTGTDFQITIAVGTQQGTTGVPKFTTTNMPFLVLQNLRFDVVPVSDGTSVNGFAFDATISVAGPDDCVTGTFPGIDLTTLVGDCLDTSTYDPQTQVGTVRNTIYCYQGGESMNFSNFGDPYFSDSACADVYRIGHGFEDGVNPQVTYPGGCTACQENPPTGGVGNTSGFLVKNAYWYMWENPEWVYVNPFRIALAGRGDPSTPDISTTPTDLVIDIETIPFGVSIEVPSTLTICQGGNPGVQWSQKSGPSSVTGNSSGTSNLIAIYQTVLGDVNDPSPGAPLIVKTGEVAADVNCGTYNPPLPTFGVQIADPSGIGNVTLRVVFGPSEGPGEFTGDDVNPAAVPRYMNPIIPSEGENPGSLSRGIIDDALGNPVCYIEIDPTRTYLLYDYVTDKSGWMTGIEVANTGNDAQVFAPLGIDNTGQAGALDVWFFPNSNPEGGAGTTPFMYTATAANGRGLQAGTGLLAPGNIWADTLDNLLTASGNGSLAGNFDGYIIIVCHFNFGHGAAYLFNANLNGTNVPALVLGGDSARLGDITKLPERLVQ
jgi:hypothetical protein